MWQAEVRVDLEAIRANVARLRAGTAAEVMAVVKGDGYGHGMVPAARAALRGGATWLGRLHPRRGAGAAPGRPHRAGARLAAGAGTAAARGVAADIDLSAASVGLLDEIVPPPAARAGRPGSISRSTPAWPAAARPRRLAGAVRGRGEGAGRRRRRGRRGVEPLRLRRRARPRDDRPPARGVRRGPRHGRAVRHQPERTGTSPTPPPR